MQERVRMTVEVGCTSELQSATHLVAAHFLLLERAEVGSCGRAACAEKPPYCEMGLSQ